MTELCGSEVGSRKRSLRSVFSVLRKQGHLGFCSFLNTIIAVAIRLSQLEKLVLRAHL